MNHENQSSASFANTRIERAKHRIIGRIASIVLSPSRNGLLLTIHVSVIKRIRAYYRVRILYSNCMVNTYNTELLKLRMTLSAHIYVVLNSSAIHLAF